MDEEIIEMYFEDGMTEEEIAKSLGISLLLVHEALAAHESSRDGEDDDMVLDEEG